MQKEEKLKIEIKTQEEQLNTHKIALQNIINDQDEVKTELDLQKRKLDAACHRLHYKKQKVEHLSTALGIKKNNIPQNSIRVSKKLRDSRLKSPTSESTKLRSKVRRRSETFQACEVIYGGTPENMEPTTNGMIDTLTARCTGKYLAYKLLQAKPSFVKELTESCIRKHSDFYKSEQNILRSLNVYYSSNVMGKRKYLNVRKANKARNIINFVTYKKLAEYINSIDIGVVKDVSPELTTDSEEEETCDGMFRELSQFAVRLTKFYLIVDLQRQDKLFEFKNINKKDPNSVMFLISVGGDEAPGSGTAFLLSFLNVANRLASSSKNFLLFGANTKENGAIVRRFILKLLSDIKYLENNVFTVNVNGASHNVEFKLEVLPNDMKMLAFLAGELSNSAYYFSTFGNVNKQNANDVHKCYDVDWKPFKYDKRVTDAQLVQKKKTELVKKKIKTNS